jgi:hypothetical protein
MRLWPFALASIATICWVAVWASGDGEKRAAPDIKPQSHMPVTQKMPAAQRDRGPDLSTWVAGGAPAAIRHDDGTRTLVTPLSGLALSAAGSGVSPKWCGVRLQSGRAQPQSLVLIGTGVTEALSCTRVKGFGKVPAPKSIDRIAFVYEGSSPNADGVLTALVIERASSASLWAINETLSYKLDESGTLTTIPAIRNFLAQPDAS